MRKLPPLATLRAFEAAARHMSFKDAADELGVTPTAISHQVRLLEEICGRDLFRRRPRPLTLTAAGERLFPVLRNGLDAFAMAFAALSEEHEARPLRVTSPNAFAGRWLVPRLPLWREAHPEVPLEVIGTDALIDLRAGDADVAIRYGIGTRLLFSWKKDLTPAKTETTFLPVTITDAADQPAEVPLSMPAPAPVIVERSAPGIEVELVGGRRVRFERDTDPETVRRLVALLEGEAR